MSLQWPSVVAPPNVIRRPNIWKDLEHRANTVANTVLYPAEVRLEERVLIVGADREALEIMCALLRRGVARVLLVRARWPVAPHSIDLIIVSSRVPRTQAIQAIAMAPRLLRACGRLVFRPFLARTTNRWRSAAFAISAPAMAVAGEAQLPIRANRARRSDLHMID